MADIIRGIFQWVFGIDSNVGSTSDADLSSDRTEIKILILERKHSDKRVVKTMLFPSMQTRDAMQGWIRKMELPHCSRAELFITNDSSRVFGYAYEVENLELTALGIEN